MNALAERLDPSGDSVSETAVKLIGLPDPFPLYRGGALRGAHIAYETWGKLNAARDNAILLFTGLSPSAHAASSPENAAAGWWERMIGPGRAIDTNKWFVVCVNSLGSCFGSTGPASRDPATGETYGVRFPELAIEDIARAGREIIRALNIERLAAVIGASLGGMVSVAFAAQFPGATRALISISGTAAATPFAVALRSLQREAITSDPDWQGGRYTDKRRPRNGMRIARKLGTITYRSAAEWQQRFGRKPRAAGAARIPPSTDLAPFAANLAVEDYLEAQANKFVDVFDANCYLYLSRAMDRFDLADHGGSVDAALAGSQVERALVIGVKSDILFTLEEQRGIAASLERSGAATTFAALESLEGHDAFLVDIEHFSIAVAQFLAQA
jgi:homoserine O-acetyltransferase/O-succinyltransferase